MSHVKPRAYHGDEDVSGSVDGLGGRGAHTEGEGAAEHLDDGLHDAQVVQDVDEREEEHHDTHHLQPESGSEKERVWCVGEGVDYTTKLSTCRPKPRVRFVRERGVGLHNDT